MARRKKPRSLLEVNTLLAAITFLPEELRASPRRLSLMEQARTMARALPKATRVGEFISMWAITKNRDGVATVETVAEMWGEAERTMYRRLEEFRVLLGWDGIHGFVGPGMEDRSADAEDLGAGGEVHGLVVGRGDDLGGDLGCEHVGVSASVWVDQ